MINSHNIKDLLPHQDPHLLLAVLGGGLGLVEPGQAAVMTLVESPGLLHGEILLSNALQHRGQGHLATINTSVWCF